MYGVIMAISSTTVLLIFIVIWAIILVYDKIKNNSNKNSNIDNNIEENNNNNNNNENNKNNHGLKIYYGIFGVLRTSAGFKIINSIGKYKFWRPISLALIPLCAIISLLTLYMFIVSTINLFSGTVPKESSKPVIFLFGNLIPWIPGIIALIIGITFHELAHGIIAKAYNLKIKSTGLLLGLGIPLGAFVELGDDFKDTTNKIRGAVASAGPMANVIIFIISLMVMPFVMGLSTPLTISNVIDGYPADNILFKGDKIISINNHKINSLVDFNNVVKDVKPNEKIEITILRNNNNNNNNNNQSNRSNKTSTRANNYTKKARHKKIPDVTNEFNSILRHTKSLFNKLRNKWKIDRSMIISDFIKYNKQNNIDNTISLFYRDFDSFRNVETQLRFLYKYFKTNGKGDIKNDILKKYNQNGGQVIYNNKIYTVEQLGNINYGVALKAFGYPMIMSTTAGGAYQLYADECFKGSKYYKYKKAIKECFGLKKRGTFFDYTGDSKMIREGYRKF